MALLRASTRKELGTRQVRRLRDKGLTPAIIYGHGRPPQSVTLGEHDLELALQHGARLLEVDVDGDVQNVLVKDLQWDTFGQMVLHVDLLRVSLDDRVEVTLPVLLRGTPAGEVDGGVVQQSITDINVECPVAAIPENIRVRISDLQVGDSLQLKDVELPEGVTLLSDGEAVLCRCSVVVEEVEAEGEAEGAAEPEVIGEKPQEEGEGSSSE